MYDVFIDMRRVLVFFFTFVCTRMSLYIFYRVVMNNAVLFSATLDSQYFHEKIRPKFEQISFFREEKNGRKKGEKTLYLVNFY